MENSEFIGPESPKLKNKRKRFENRSNECRIVITTECNISCPYCINQFDAVKKRFMFERMEDVVRHKYDTYNITGGEPFIEVEKLRRICTEIKKYNPLSTITVYTNGYGTEEINEIDKYFMGCHLGFFHKCIERLVQLRNSFPTKYIELMIEHNTYFKHKTEIDALENYCSNIFIWKYDSMFDYSLVRPNETFYIV